MTGMLTEQRRNKKGLPLRRRSQLFVGERKLVIRYRRAGRTSMPRALRSCDQVLLPVGTRGNRPYKTMVFRHLLPQVLKKLERVHFPDHSVCVGVVAPQLTPEVKKAFYQTLWVAGNCIICTESRDESWADNLMDEYGLTALSTANQALLKQADLVLCFQDPNLLIRQCKQGAVVLNFSDIPMQVHYGRIVVEGVETKTIPNLFEELPQDADWTAFCGCFLPELKDELQLKQIHYAS